MWAVSNQTAFKADRAFARDQDGAEVWIVAVRATFDIRPDGSVQPSQDQQDVCLAPKYVGEIAQSSLLYEMDLVRTKVATDVLLHGQAHTPGKREVSFLDVEMRVGPISKTLRIHGDRVWERSPTGLVPGRAAPFVTMPICYERALGGALTAEPSSAQDSRNRVGVGRCGEAGRTVPNIEYPGEGILAPTHSGLPAGFGPIPCDWDQRVRLAGTYDEVWQRERQPLVPQDFQNSYFQCAPADQQVHGFLRGGEEVILRNLTPEGLLRFRLPRISLGFRTRIDGGVTHHRAEIHTVILEPETRRLIMVWQTSLACHHTLYTLKETTVFEKTRVPLGGEVEKEAELLA